LRCGCASHAVRATLRRPIGATAWHADVTLPAGGTWLASVAARRRRTPPVALAVGDAPTPGPQPLEVIETADLASRDADRCRAQSQGLALAIGRLNASGGLDGRKVLLRVQDDGGDLQRAAAAVRAAARRGAIALAAPCGAAAAAALRAAPRLPALVADPEVPIVQRRRLWRLAGDPTAEGQAIGRYIDREGLVAAAGRPHRVVALVAGRATAAGRDRIAALRATLRRSRVRLSVVDLPHDAAGARAMTVRTLDARRALAVVLDGDEQRLARALARAGNDPALVPPAIIATSPLLDEDFQLGAGALGREGAIRSPAEVTPDSRDALGYAAAVSAIFPGDRPSIAGLRGYVTGLALDEALRDGRQPGRIAARLRKPRRFTDALQSPWRAQAPANGSILFAFLAPRFLPANLIPVADGGEQFSGRWFPDGAWTQTTSEVYGPPL
jgi:ABC-type branched-subunit amino acid transport system substrate-binding protein